MRVWYSSCLSPSPRSIARTCYHKVHDYNRNAFQVRPVLLPITIWSSVFVSILLVFCFCFASSQRRTSEMFRFIFHLQVGEWWHDLERISCWPFFLYFFFQLHNCDYSYVTWCEVAKIHKIAHFAIYFFFLVWNASSIIGLYKINGTFN